MVVTANTVGWVSGFTVGGVVVLLVAVLVIMLAVLASRIASEAAGAYEALERAQQATSSLHTVDEVNGSAVRVLEGARAARRALTGG